MISIHSLSKSFRIPRAHKRSIKGSLFSFFDRKTYQKIEVLKDFNLQVQTGEFVGIMGSNGSGKSTLLKLIAGVYQPDEGSISVEGKLATVLELGTGFHPELTARENIFIHGLLIGLSQAQIERRLSHIIHFAGLEQFVNAPLKHFSSGMVARLAFSVAMQVQAEVYLMDEVLAVGDQEFQAKCLQVFQNLKRQGVTLLFVSHSEELVRDICDRVINMDAL